MKISLSPWYRFPDIAQRNRKPHYVAKFDARLRASAVCVIIRGNFSSKIGGCGLRSSSGYEASQAGDIVLTFDSADHSRPRDVYNLGTACCEQFSKKKQ